MKDGINPMWEDNKNRIIEVFLTKFQHKNTLCKYGKIYYMVFSKTISNEKVYSNINVVVILLKKIFVF